jgi:hypothetical protein
VKFLAHLGFLMAMLMAVTISAIVEKRTGFSADFGVGWMACYFYGRIFERRTP